MSLGGTNVAVVERQGLARESTREQGKSRDDVGSMTEVAQRCVSLRRGTAALSSNFTRTNEPSERRARVPASTQDLHRAEATPARPT